MTEFPTFYLAFIEDGEGCGFQTHSLHASEEGALAAVRLMIYDERGIEGEDDDDGRLLSDYTTEELITWMDQEEGKTAGVTAMKVLP